MTDQEMKTRLEPFMKKYREAGARCYREDANNNSTAYNVQFGRALGIHDCMMEMAGPELFDEYMVWVNEVDDEVYMDCEGGAR